MGIKKAKMARSEKLIKKFSSPKPEYSFIVVRVEKKFHEAVKGANIHISNVVRAALLKSLQKLNS